VDSGCSCYACQHFSRSYLRHLILANEILGLHLTTLHNLHFMLTLMSEIRDAILQDRFPRAREEFLASYRVADYGAAQRDKQAWLSKRKTSEERVRD